MSFLKEATQSIKATGGRMTEQRRIICEVLEAETAAHDAESLYDIARQQDESISLATVYRTLKLLEDAQLIRQHYRSADHQQRIYEVIRAPRSTFHFTCTQCKQVTAFQLDDQYMFLQNIEQQVNAQAANVCICVTGLCLSCANEQEQR